jgi:hypothetical protein
MNWRTIAETRLGQDPEDTILVSGRLHDSTTGRCTCEQCLALENSAAIIAELLRPGESRQIAIEGSPLFLVVKRHQFPSRPVQSSVSDNRADERLQALTRRGRGFSLLRR